MQQRDLPETLQQELMYCIETSLGDTNGEIGRAQIEQRPTVQHQSAIGFHQIMRGFISSTWRHSYETINQRYGSKGTLEPLDFFAGLIKLIWNQQMLFWEDHLSVLHQSKEATIPTPHDRLHSYKTKIRSLYAKRDQCLPKHREIYFHQDLDQFLATAKASQMRQYLLSYEPAILSSIKAAQLQPMRTIFSFPGFVRSRIQGNSQNQQRPPPGTNLVDNPSEVSRGAILHRKHTRWRTALPSMLSIRKFFHTSPD
jgi:hypothetical protein